MAFIRYVQSTKADGSDVIGFVNTDLVLSVTYDVKGKVLVLNATTGKFLELSGEAAEDVAKAIRRLPTGMGGEMNDD